MTPPQHVTDPYLRQRLAFRADIATPDQSTGLITSQDQGEPSLAIPEELAILPLRGTVVYPLTVVPITVGQPRSIKLIDDAVVGERMIGLVASRRPDLEEPGPDDLFEIGAAAIVHRLFRAPDGTVRLLVQAGERIRIGPFTQTTPYLRAKVHPIPDIVETSIETQALMRTVLDQFRRLIELAPGASPELLAAVMAVEDPRQLAYFIANTIRMDFTDAQAILEMDSVAAKLRRLIELLSKELEVLELGKKIQSEARSEMEKMQREYFLREQLKAIQRELGEGDEQAAEIEEFRRKIDAAHMPEEAEKEARRELDRLERLPTAAAEYGIIRTYLDWLTSLPWNVTTPDNLDIAHARQILDEDHYDLEEVKDRILEYLAVRKLRQERAGEQKSRGAGEQEDIPPTDFIRREREGVILCFVGPPGVGKTSLGQSIARALGRKFIRMSLGGVRDEAEIRGHRRTYIGALPGRIIQALRRVGTRNPVFMLDEIDKLGMDFRGDPASALLEVLDPEQNREFRDHYLDVPFDLSQVMFITTANMLEPIPGPLRDRMEILTLSGYTETEKVRIAQGYLVPRQLRENGLRPGEVSFSDEALHRIVRDYTREAGVRALEQQIGRVCRKIATRLAEGRDAPSLIQPEHIQEFLGKPRFFSEVAERTQIPGVATGLSWTPVGGEIIFVEAAAMPGSKGFILTGQLGDVMQESARAALSYVRSHSKDLGIPDDYFEKHDIHVHVPGGAVPKDGPSAGVTMATAIASLVTGRPVRSDVAMTGEITLRGHVLPVGGIKEKVLAAHRAGLTTVILPQRNERDLDDVPEEARRALHFILADRVEDVIKAALSDQTTDDRRRTTDDERRSIEDRLPSEGAPRVENPDRG